jgi:NAD(P)-dependent dehydrogenase (short-subunit alcohol dehydrogenase family)
MAFDGFNGWVVFMTDRQRSVMITGGTSGIGLACATHLSASGVGVWITGTTQRTVDAALAAGVARGGSVCDVRDHDAMLQTFDKATSIIGEFDGVFANAGIDGEGKPAEELSATNFRHILNVNVVGVLNTAQAAYTHLRRPGQLVINASVNALRPERNFADYNASKAAAKSIADTLALEWASEGISVVTIAPGYVPSRMTQPYLDNPAARDELLADIPIGRFGEPTEVARLVSFLLDPASAYLNGATISIDGGAHL